MCGYGFRDDEMPGRLWDRSGIHLFARFFSYADLHIAVYGFARKRLEIGLEIFLMKKKDSRFLVVSP
jgi:hypothetical protein